LGEDTNEHDAPHDAYEGILRGVFKILTLFAEEIQLKRILIKSLITNQTHT